MTYADVFGHFETGDAFEAALGDGDVAVVHAQDVALLFGDAGLAETVVTPGGLIATKGDTGHMGTVVDAGVFGESAPATADVEHLVTGLDIDLLAHNGQLVVLELLQGLLLVDVGNDARGVDHTRTKEPAIEVVTTVVVVSDLLLILRTGV